MRRFDMEASELDGVSKGGFADKVLDTPPHTEGMRQHGSRGAAHCLSRTPHLCFLCSE
jgi:hypothetical protein